MTPDEYRAKRNRWLPRSAEASPRLVFIAESPPAGGGYFYDLDTPPTALFEAMTACLFRDAVPESRVQALDRFRDAGFILVDATYTPVNRLPPAERSDLLLKGRENLIRDLKGLLGAQWREVPLVLIKSNVHALLASFLAEQGFSVANPDVAIPFPLYQWRRTFCERVRDLLIRLGCWPAAVPVS